MTKNFCDLCGEPALPFYPEMKVVFPDLAWTGVKMSPGCSGVIEGTWTPYIKAGIVFEHHDTPRSVRSAHPDLCGDCIAKLMTQMAVGVAGSRESRE